MIYIDGERSPCSRKCESCYVKNRCDGEDCYITGTEFRMIEQCKVIHSKCNLRSGNCSNCKYRFMCYTSDLKLKEVCYNYRHSECIE